MIMEPTSHSPVSSTAKLDAANTARRYVTGLGEAVHALGKPVIDTSMKHAAAYFDAGLTQRDSDAVQRSMRAATNLEEGILNEIKAPQTEEIAEGVLHNKKHTQQLKVITLGRHQGRVGK